MGLIRVLQFLIYIGVVVGKRHAYESLLKD